MEDAYLGKATERFFLQLLRVVVPEIVDMNMPIEGGFHNVVVVSIRKRYPGQAKKVMAGDLGHDADDALEVHHRRGRECGRAEHA